MPMPGIFSAIAGRQKEFYENKRTEEFCKELPPGVVEYAEKWVQSVPIVSKTSKTTCYIKGRFDMVIKFDDGTYGVIDCKTARPSDEKSAMYGRQLQAYTYALENPAQGKLNLSPVSKLGLLYFKPTDFKQVSGSRQAFEGDLIWHEVPRDDGSFMDFMHEVISVLDDDSIKPQTCENCTHCSAGNTCYAGKQDAEEKGCTCCAWCNYRAHVKDDALPNPFEKVIEQGVTCPKCGSGMVRKQGKFGVFLSCENYPDCKGTKNL
jgi:hypothetical protein